MSDTTSVANDRLRSFVECIERLLEEEHSAQPDGWPICRICGCWEMAACWDDQIGACWWVEPDLCSHCRNVAISAERERDAWPSRKGRRCMTATSNQDSLLPLQIRGELQAIISLALRICDASEPPRDTKEAPGNLRAHALSGAVQASAFQIHQLLHGRTLDEAEALAAIAESVVEAWRKDELKGVLLAELERGVEEYRAAKDGGANDA